MDALKWILISAGILIGAFGIFLLYFTVTDYSPAVFVKLEKVGKGLEMQPLRLTLMSWNLGYAGLGKSMDFFMDGGTKVKATKEETERNLKGILSVVKIWKKNVDVFFFQEVDVDSDRSYNINEYEPLKDILKGYESTFAYNYHVDFVPVPLNSPMGKVKSGIAVFSKYSFKDPTRVALPGEYPWPIRIFHLDRCMIVVRIPAPDGKEWLLINTHNSAYDSGDLRKQQLDFIKTFITKEYEKGNYVVIGGDWNIMLGSNFEFSEATPTFYKPLPKNFTPKGWKWAVDLSVPTNRSLATPYVEGRNFVTVIDGFLVSPNVKIINVKGLNLGFEYSDHNPVIVTVEIQH